MLNLLLDRQLKFPPSFTGESRAANGLESAAMDWVEVPCHSSHEAELQFSFHFTYTAVTAVNSAFLRACARIPHWFLMLIALMFFLVMVHLDCWTVWSKNHLGDWWSRALSLTAGSPTKRKTLYLNVGNPIPLVALLDKNKMEEENSSFSSVFFFCCFLAAETWAAVLIRTFPTTVN